MEDKLLYWFAAKTKPRQEKFIKDKLNGLAIENFIPLRMELRQWKYRKKGDSSCHSTFGIFTYGL